MRSLVLGCGPAGLMAAHAIKLATGVAPDIASKMRMSHLYGAQYLHEAIPGITDGPGSLIDYDLIGTPDEYRLKVYGEKWRDRVSPEDLIGQHLAWDIRSAYDALWAEYSARIHEFDVESHTAQQLSDKFIKYDLVVSSVPKPKLCFGGHTFSAQEVWAVGDAYDRGQLCPVRTDYNTVVCNGKSEPAWYRASNVFGYCTAEWSGARPPIPEAARVSKPLKNNCDCWPDRMLFVGRYGAWRKGVLSHHAFEDTLDEVV